VGPAADRAELRRAGRRRDVLADLLDRSDNGSLAFAAEEYSRSAAARAQRLADAGRVLLDEHGAAPADRDVKLRFEAVLREIDAGFVTADLAEPLAGVREQLVAAVSGVPAQV